MKGGKRYNGFLGVRKACLILPALLIICFVKTSLCQCLQSGQSFTEYVENIVQNDPDIQQIACHNQGITGTIPKALGKLKKLTLLRLHTNNFIGPLPTEIGEMSELRHLDIHSNVNLKSTLPSEIGKLQKMGRIDAFYTNMHGQIPTELGNLPALWGLFIELNDISGTIPSQLGQLSSLRFLQMFSNRLNGTLPTQLGNLSPQLMDRFYLNDNRLTGTLPTELGKLTDLKRLVLNGNILTGTVPLEYIELQELTNLALAGTSSDLAFMCDNKYLEWYQSKGGSESINCVNNNVYGELSLTAGVLRSDKLAPETHAVLDISEITAERIAIAWSYDGFIPDIPSIPMEARNLVAGCEDFVLSDPTSDETLLGFEINWNDNKICLLSDEVQQLDYFEYNVTTYPDTTYDITIQPFNLYLSQNSAKLVFGVQSKTFNAKTYEARPGVAPQNVILTDRTSSTINVEWDEITSREKNGKIIMYQVECAECKEKMLMTSSNSIQIIGLSPLREYSFVIRAETSVGQGPPSSMVVYKTCRPNTYSSTSDGKCGFAETGYFINSVGIAVACSDFLNEIDQQSCIGTHAKNTDSLTLKRGFWRPYKDSLQGVKLCPNPEFCNPIIHNDTNAFGQNSSDQYCSSYHTGVYCSDCLAGYKLSSSGCVQCDNSKEDEDKQKVIALLAVFVFLIFLYQLRVIASAVDVNGEYINVTKMNQKLDQLSSFFVDYVSTKLQIFIITCQILFSFQKSLTTKAYGTGYDNVFFALISLDLDVLISAMDFNCFGEFNFFQKLLFVTLFPLAVVTSLFLIYGILRKFINDEDKAKMVYAKVFSIFLLIGVYTYEPVSQTIIQTFLCERIGSGDKEYLRADYRLSCDSTEYQSYLIYSAFMVVLYPFGILATYIYLLHTRRQLFLQKPQNHYIDETAEDKLKIVQFLTRPYREKYYWFEVSELIRRILMTSFLSIVMLEEEALGKGYVGEAYAFILVILSAILLEITRPYKHKDDWMYSLFSLFVLSLATQVSLWSKFIVDEYVNESNRSKAEYESSMYTALFWVETCMFVLFLIAGFRANKGKSEAGVKRHTQYTEQRVLKRRLHANNPFYSREYDPSTLTFAHSMERLES